LDQLLVIHPEITCVFAASDILAVGVLLQANHRGLRVPADLAVAGFDDVGLADKISPPLTTVRVPRRAIGRIAAEIILDRLANHDSASRVVDAGYELVERGSA
jgi:LacI family gluconate utilization system Gnt-I transcriptional repressor